MKQLLRTFLCGALLLGMTAAPAASAATVEVRVAGVTAKGTVNVAVCDKERFLKQCTYSAAAPARAGETLVLVTGVPPGRWALVVYQDENTNGALDTNFLGIPKEPYGFSRDARSKFGPPSFEDATIDVRDGPEATAASVRLR